MGRKESMESQSVVFPLTVSKQWATEVGDDDDDDGNDDGNDRNGDGDDEEVKRWF